MQLCGTFLSLFCVCYMKLHSIHGCVSFSADRLDKYLELNNNTLSLSHFLSLSRSLCSREPIHTCPLSFFLSCSSLFFLYHTHTHTYQHTHTNTHTHTHTESLFCCLLETGDHGIQLLEMDRSEEHTSELQSHLYLVCRLLNDTATTEIYTLSLHDALPISHTHTHTQSHYFAVSLKQVTMESSYLKWIDRKSTRLNSSHTCISYAVF